MSGNVKILVEGFNLDLIINKLHLSQIPCFDIKKSDVNTMTFSVHVKYLRKVKSLLKNYNYTIKYLGLSRLKQMLTNNIPILIALPFIIVACCVSTKFIWKVQIYGGDDSLQQQVMQVLDENNIQIGKSFKYSNSQIEQLLLDQLPTLAQVSCIRKGTNIVINISKKLVYTPDTFEPIKAKYSGVITEINLIAGTMAVKVGEFVTDGEILVLPYNYDKNGELVSVKPMAEIIAKAYVVETCKLSSSTTVLSRTGKTYTTSSIKLCNKNLFSKKVVKPFDIYEISVYNENVSDVLPILRSTITYHELEYVEVSNDLNAEKGALEDKAYNTAYSKLPVNSQVIDEQRSSVIVDNVLYCTTSLTILAAIS